MRIRERSGIRLVPARRATRVGQFLLAAWLLGVANAGPFWWAVLVRTLPAPIATWMDALMPGQRWQEFWPFVLVAAGFVWGGAVGFLIEWSFFVLRCAIAGALGNGIFALAIVMGVVHEPLSAVLPGQGAERFVLLLPILVGLVTGATGVALGFAAYDLQLAAHLGLRGALAGFLPALAVVGLLYVVGLRVGAGDAAMARVTAPAFMASATAAGTWLSCALSNRRQPAQPHRNHQNSQSHQL